MTMSKKYKSIFMVLVLISNFFSFCALPSNDTSAATLPFVPPGAKIWENSIPRTFNDPYRYNPEAGGDIYSTLPDGSYAIVFASLLTITVKHMSDEGVMLGLFNYSLSMTHGSFQKKSTILRDMITDSEGNLIIIGEQKGTPYTAVGAAGFGFMLKISGTDFSKLWEKQVLHPGEVNLFYDEVSEVIETDDGYVVSGRFAVSSDIYFAFVEGYAKSDGSQIFTMDQAERISGHYDRFLSLIQTNDGGFLAVGRSNSSSVPGFRSDNVTWQSSSWDPVYVVHDGYVAKFAPPSDGVIHREWHRCYGTRWYDTILAGVQTLDGYMLFADYDNDGAQIDPDKLLEVNGEEVAMLGFENITVHKIGPLGDSNWLRPTGSGYDNSNDKFIHARANADGTVTFAESFTFYTLDAPGGDVSSHYAGTNLWTATFGAQSPDDPHIIPQITDQALVCAWTGTYSYEVLKPEASSDCTSFIFFGGNNLTLQALTAKVVRIVNADLSVELQDQTPAPVQGGQKVILNNIVRNLGPDDGAKGNVQVTVTPSDAFTGITVTDAPGDTSAVNGNIITLNLGNLAVSSQRHTTIEIQLKDDFHGNLNVTSIVSPVNGTDIVPDNNTSSVNISVEEKIPECDNYIDAFYRENEQLGEYTGYITFGNNGPDTSVDTIVTCRIDKSTALLSASPEEYTTGTDGEGFTVVSWDVGDLAPGFTNYIEGDPSSYYKVVTKLNNGIVRGTLLFSKHTIAGDTLDIELEEEGSQNEHGVWYGMLPDLSLEIEADDAHIHTFAQGDSPYQYTVTLKNDGDKEANDITLTVNVPEGLKDVEYLVTNIPGLDHSFDPGTRLITCTANMLNTGGTIEINIQGSLHQWYQDEGYNFELQASVKAKSDAGLAQYDLNALADKDIQVLRPDIGVSYSYPQDNDNKYIYIAQDTTDPSKKRVRIDIENTGPGNSHEFWMDITLHDPSDSFTQMQAVANSTNVLSIDKMDADGKVWRIKVSDPVNTFLGLVGTYSNSRNDDNKRASVEFELTCAVGHDAYDTAIISVEPHYETIGFFSDTISDIDYLNADRDNQNDTALIYLEFFRVNIDDTAWGTYELQTNSIQSQCSVLLDYNSTATDIPALADVEITEIFPYFETYYGDSDVFELYFMYACGSVPTSERAFGKGVRLSVEEELDPEHYTFVTLTKSYKSEIGDAYYLSNLYEIEAEITFRLKGSDVTHKITRKIEFSVAPPKPVIYSPLTGQICNLNKPFEIVGFALPGSEVYIYETGSPFQAVGTTYADDSGRFTYITNGGLSSFYVKSLWGDEWSDLSKIVNLTESDHCWCPQRSYWEGEDPTGKNFKFRFRNRQSGLPSTTGWSIMGFGGFWDSVLNLYINPDHEVGEVYVIADNVKYSAYYRNDEYYIFNIKSAHDVMIYVECPEKESASYGSVLIDPDGFVFDSGLGFSNVVPGAKVTCMVYDPENNIWYEWPAAAYDDQVNPQIVDHTGYFSFYTPPGTYRLMVENPDPYQDWISPDLTVVADLVTCNIPYEKLPETDPVYLIRAYPDALLDPSGEDMSDITVNAGEVVEWMAYPSEGASQDDIPALNVNPQVRIKSSIDVEQDFSGFDSGMLMPYFKYRHQFDYAGTFTYTFIEGSTILTGKVTVIGSGPAVDTRLPDTPGSAEAVVSDNGNVSLSWQVSSDNVGITGYEIYRCIDSDMDFEMIGTVDTTEFVDTTAVRGSSYIYYIVSKDTSGNTSHRSSLLYVQIAEQDDISPQTSHTDRIFILMVILYLSGAYVLYSRKLLNLQGTKTK